jgi:hypothetical protein
MMKYMEPEMQCIRFAVEDIITTSSVELPTESELIPIDPDEGAIV